MRALQPPLRRLFTVMALSALFLSLSGTAAFTAYRHLLVGGRSGQCPAIGINPGSLPNGMTGVAYDQPLSASPAGSYSYNVVQGALPAGMVLKPATGSLGGIPTVVGTYSFTVKAADANGCSGTRAYTLAITCPTITLSSLPTPTLNAAYSQTITASPVGGNYSFAITGGALPSGLTLNSATGLLSGTPTQSGAYNFTITATGFGSCTGSRTYSGAIAAACAVTLPALSNGAAGQLYSQSVMPSPPGYYTYTLTGSLPAGLTFYNTVGLIFGFPTTGGTFNFTLTATDSNGCSASRAYAVVIEGPSSASGITLTEPANGVYLNTQPVTVRGTVGNPSSTVTVNGIAAPVSGGTFVATVPLNEGPNTLTAVASNPDGTTNTASTLVTLDTTPPRVEIYSPVNGSVTSDASVTVTGLVNDIVVGTVNSQQATVTVNGAAAQVLNRTFTTTNVPLAMGANTIQARGVDRVGNSATTTITITRQAATQPTLRIFSGNGQSGPIRGLLSAPLVAQLTNAAGQPMPNTPVIFRVLNQDGMLSPNGAPGTEMSSMAVNTDPQGLASVRFFLGSRAGAGNNLVEASATGVTSTAVFNASATPATAGLIIVDNGNNQSGVSGQPLPLPFVAVVTDTGFNRLAGVPVTFTVKSGGGSFAGQPTTTATSDGDGRVMATLTLGPNAGINNNIVEASFAGNAGFPATFTASGQTPGLASATKITGVVLDNSNNPLQGVTMRLFQVNQGNNGNIPQQVATPAQTNAQGQFTMQPVPVGVFKLMADGGTAQRPGSWPTIEYDLITVAGQNNTVGSPIYLPELLSNNRLCVSPTTGGTLTIPQAPGFSLTVAPGSAIFPGGSRTGCISVTPVNMDKVPMVPGFGQQPRFVVTIQPVGTIFSIPAAITIPNVDGLLPRAVTEMYSFDHDLASFVAIGTGTVSEDGSVIRSDPGVGVLKAGWHCGGNPNQTGSAGTCPDCQKCQGNNCVADSSKNGRRCSTPTVPNGNCKDGTCVRFTADILVNNTTTNTDDITVLNPAQTIPVRITLHGGDGQVQLSVMPAGRATIDRSSLNLTDGGSDTVTITPTARSQAVNDVIIKATVDGNEVGMGNLTIVNVTIPTINASNTPAGVPNRIPPRVDSRFQVEVLPDLGSSGQVITLATLNTSANNGNFTIDGGATKNIATTTMVALRGTVQTAATSGLGGGNANNLQMVAKVRGVDAVRSPGFSVAALAINTLEALVGPVANPGAYGIVVSVTVQSDSGTQADLDQVDFSEQIQVDAESGALVGLGGGLNSSYLPAVGTYTDTHSTGISRVTGVGSQHISQTHTLRDRRLGVTDIPVPQSGYFIDRIAFLASSVLRFTTSKTGAATTANGFAANAGLTAGGAMTLTQP